MKRMALLIAALLTFQTAVILAQEPSVSIPAGFVRVVVEPGEQQLVSLPWFPWDDSVNAVLKHAMRGASNEAADRVLKFIPLLPGYEQAVKMDGTGNAARDGRWVRDFASGGKDSELTLNPGEGFILVNKDATEPKTVYLCGLVVLEATVSLEIEPALNLAGYPFAGVGTGELEGLAPGSATWLYSHEEAQKTLDFTRPYANLFPTNPAALPRIAGMTPAADGRSIALNIQASGADMELLDIYSQDMPTNGTFCAEGPWRALALDLETQGRTEGTWSDPLGENPPYARVYLIASVGPDSDRDGDGIPDARQKFLSAQELARIKTMALERGRLLPPGNGASAQDAINPTKGRFVYVDRHRGQDGFSGRLAVITVNGSDGPKQSIRAGLAETKPGDTLIIREGAYGEPLNVAGKGISVQIRGHVDLTGKK